jgi:hypothetical protein
MMIKQIAVVERSKEAFVYIEGAQGYELLMVFESVRALFERWDPAREPTLDVVVYFDGWEEAPWKNSDREHTSKGTGSTT